MPDVSVLNLVEVTVSDRRTSPSVACFVAYSAMPFTARTGLNDGMAVPYAPDVFEHLSTQMANVSNQGMCVPEATLAALDDIPQKSTRRSKPIRWSWIEDLNALGDVVLTHCAATAALVDGVAS
jgi:hypothetical protein